LRIKYPGICALFFEYALDIVIEEVIGWSMRDGKQQFQKPGLLGVVEAFTVTVEEQGRQTLHSHIQVWIKEFNDWREDLYSNQLKVRQSAKRNIEEYIDQISKCTMFFANENSIKGRGKVAKCFPHECSVKRSHDRQHPKVVDDQALRNLRQKM
jgi:hypothetical protein